MDNYKALRIIISGGGTGGHIFPAISIANKMMELNPESKILFVGAEGKMEMDKGTFSRIQDNRTADCGTPAPAEFPQYRQ